MIFASRLAAVTLAAMMCSSVPVFAQQPVQQQPPMQQQMPPEQQQQLPPPVRQPSPNTYGPDELTNAGHRFFGNVSREIGRAHV